MTQETFDMIAAELLAVCTHDWYTNEDLVLLAAKHSLQYVGIHE